MKTVAQKVVVTVAVVVGMALGSGAIDASAANPQSVNALAKLDSGGSISVTGRYAPAAETVHQSRYRVGPEAEV
jgi:hypothetical protein